MRQRRWLLFVVVSLLLHSASIAVVRLTSAGLMEQTKRGQDGENGRNARGAGSAEFSVLSPPTPARHAETTPAAVTPAPEPVPVPAARPEPPRPPPPTRPRAALTPPTAAPAAPSPVAPPTSQTASPAASMAPSSPTPSSAPSAASAPSTGLRTGSVGEQRGLLPSAARCNDPVAGVWRAHKYNPIDHDWVIFTLRIQHLPDNRLLGEIRARLWNGMSMDVRPPGHCGGQNTDLDYLVRMPAQGSIVGDRHVTFSSITYRVEHAYCPSAYFGYNPDAFSGDIDVERQEFQSMNNDGGRDQNAPYVFRRIGCAPGDRVSVLPAPTPQASPVVDESHL
ncbi:MAG: hypothetical protein Q8Q09_17565 [Deltaproteobacteria bacterium]|nr:hypothetical protein [Deltaproteobacteria bacterium]